MGRGYSENSLGRFGKGRGTRALGCFHDEGAGLT
jgi:hypothetical protein